MSARALAALAAVLVLAAGCGDDATPSEQVPALADRLHAVDEAVAAHDDAATRKAVDELERTATEAEKNGDLDAASAEEITLAADALVAALPDEKPTETPSESASTPTEESSPTPPPAPPEKHEGKGEKDKPPKPEKPGKEEHGHED